MKKARLVIILVVGLAVLVGAMVFMGTKRSAKIAEMEKQAVANADYKRADVYLKGSDDDKKYVEGLFTYAKDTVKSSLNGFFAFPPNENKYYSALYQVMVDQANQQGKADIAKSIRNFAVGRNYVGVK